MKGPGRFIRTLAVSPAVAVLAALTVVAVPPPLARAATETYTIDPEHTSIGFRVSHLVFSKVSGRFNKFEGTIVMDPANPDTDSVRVTIEAASIDTNEAARDKHLRSDAFFDVETHPKITFQSTRVRQGGDKKLTIDGNLTIRGTTKPVTLDVEMLGVGPDGYGGHRAGFEGRARIIRQDFGVSWNDVVEGGGLMVGNEVEIILGIEAIRQKVPAAQSGTKGH
jgi:polyisoprenoid-binding protein YceI